MTKVTITQDGGLNSFDKSTTTYVNNVVANVGWANPTNMVDGNIATYAHSNTTGENITIDGMDTQFSGFGTISKVEMRVYHKALGVGSPYPKIQIVISSVKGDTYSIPYSASATWSDWQNVTSDTVAPSTWTNAIVNAMQVYIVSADVPPADNLYIYKVEVRVTYSGTLKFKQENL